MLTIQNPTKGADSLTGIIIGSFKLKDAGLCYGNDVYVPDGYYSFKWSYYDEPRSFKCYLEREPIEGTTSMYNFEIYDEGAKIQGKIGVNGKAGLIYASSVGTHTHLKDRIGFYTWMTNQIVKFMGVC
jgi:hypothetical protein